MLKVKIKKLHPNAVIPNYAKPGDAGLDLVAISREYKNGQYIYDTGLAFEIPEGFVGLIFPRSSIFKKDLTLSNSVGVLDSQYRGSVKFIFNEVVKQIDTMFGLSLLKDNQYNIGDRIGQLIILPYPQVQFEEVTELSETERGTGGFGSSGT